jgi:hypothetical protein
MTSQAMAERDRYKEGDKYNANESILDLILVSKKESSACVLFYLDVNLLH